MAMLGFNSSLEIGRKALRASELALEVTGHNIANVNTPGYSRQSIEMKAGYPYQSAIGTFGLGVEVSSVKSIRDQFIDFQIVGQNSKGGGAESRLNVLEEVETVFDETMGYGLSNSITDYFNSFLELAARPEDLDLRQNVIGKSEVMIDSFKSKYNNLLDIQSRSDEQVKVLADEVNVITDRIAELNSIVGGYENSSEANDVQDERRELIDRLSELVNINTFETDEGFINISLENGGAPLVAGAESFNLVLQRNSSNHNFYDIGVDAGASIIDVTGDITDGRIGGQLDARDNFVPEYLEYLDTLAYGITSSVNSLHTTGFDLNGNAGQNFFNVFTPTTPGDYSGMVNSLSLNTAVQDDPRLIAASATGSVGDNQIAQQIAALTTNTNTIDADHDGVNDFGPFSSYYNALLNDIGSKSNRYQEVYDNQRVIITELENKRDSISGVNLDEEASTMMQYQHSYQAAARYFNTINDLLDLLVNGLGK
jgi:flagellar hook-associated protein 1 FlgK